MKKYLIFSLLLCVKLHAMFLFQAYPTLEHTIPIARIANLPTPITECSHLEIALHHPHLYIKNDGLTGSKGLYGGNKVRKLQFLLGDAKKHNAKTIVTYGCFGTNHGLATACYAHALGFDCILMLKPQPNSPVVRQNLLLDHYFNAEIRTFPNNAIRTAAREQLLAEDTDAYFFPTGGSTARGALGYVDAAFELKEQIEQGIMPEPHYIYLPLGSGGTTAGLLLGLKLANIHSIICAIEVEPAEHATEFEDTVTQLFRETNQLLHEHDATIPLVEFPHEQIIYNEAFRGPDYGVWLRAGEDATRLMLQEEGIAVEGTYSAKAVAALVADINNNIRSKDDVILLWNTYCGLDFSHLTNDIDYKQLNPEVHRYFEDAQLVDVHQINPDILLDLKFATADNFTKEILYNTYQCLLLRPVAENLNNAAKEFAALGYMVKIWDGYRPPKVSARLWELMPDEKFIADPKNGGSRHNRGCAVDLTLVDKNGVELDMGTYFCEFSEKAYRTYQDLPVPVLENRKFLETIMNKHGFTGLPTEWWHFDYKDWLQYPIIDISL